MIIYRHNDCTCDGSGSGSTDVELPSYAQLSGTVGTVSVPDSYTPITHLNTQIQSTFVTTDIVNSTFTIQKTGIYRIFYSIQAVPTFQYLYFVQIYKNGTTEIDASNKSGNSTPIEHSREVIADLVAGDVISLRHQDVFNSTINYFFNVSNFGIQQIVSEANTTVSDQVSDLYNIHASYLAGPVVTSSAIFSDFVYQLIAMPAADVELFFSFEYQIESSGALVEC